MNWAAVIFQATMLVCGITIIVAIIAVIIAQFTGAGWPTALTTAGAVFAFIAVALFLIVIFSFHE